MTLTPKKATGVKVITRVNKGNILNLNGKGNFSYGAASIASTSILMHPNPDRFPNGMGNDSEPLGRIYGPSFRVGASGKFDGF